MAKVGSQGLESPGWNTDSPARALRTQSVNRVLTKAYNAIYGDDDEEGEEAAQMQLMTAPLAAAEEIERLFTAQLIDRETALPAALHSLGATPEEIEKAMERGREKDQKVCDCEDASREFQQNDQKLQLKERAAGLETTGEKNKVELEQAKANVDKTKKETTEIGTKPPSRGST